MNTEFKITFPDASMTKVQSLVEVAALARESYGPKSNHYQLILAAVREAILNGLEVRVVEVPDESEAEPEQE